MNIADDIWLIGAIIYVLGMFPLFYFYSYTSVDKFGAILTNLTYISIFGAVGVLFLFMLVGAWGNGPKDEDL